MLIITDGQIIAGVFSGLSILLSLYLMYKHLRNYTSPYLQKYIVRILLMVPIYATDSWLSLISPNYSLLWDLMRDCYEAYCIYCFFALMVTYVQSAKQTNVGKLLETKANLEHPVPLCCLPKIKLGRKFLRQCYQFILQFVFLKPLISLTSVLMYYYDEEYYDDDNILKANNSYLWLTLLENFSITLSLYYLVLYYMATKEELKPFKPVGKFICIKAVIFFSFWQGVVISVLADLDILQPAFGYSQANIGRVLQDFVICIEMFILSIAHHFVFPYRDFHDPNKVPFLWDPDRKRIFVNPRGSIQPVVENFMKVASLKDVLEDTRNSFLVPLTISAEGVKVKNAANTNNDHDDIVEENIVVIDEYEPLISSDTR